MAMSVSAAQIWGYSNFHLGWVCTSSFKDIAQFRNLSGLIASTQWINDSYGQEGFYSALSDVPVAHFLRLGGGLFQTVIQALVISWLDYCNVFYMSLHLKTIWKLKLIQNTVLWKVMGMPQYSQNTPLLWKMDCLPISFWVWLKMIITAYKWHRVWLLEGLSVSHSICPNKLIWQVWHAMNSIN